MKRRTIKLAFCSDTDTSDNSSQRMRIEGPLWRQIRKTVIRRDGRCCRWCGIKCHKIHIDHIVPLTKGGSNHVRNLTVSCSFCNISKGNRLWHEWRFPLGRCA